MKNRKVKILLIVFILLVIVGTAYYLYRKQSAVEDLAIKDPINTEAQQAIDYYCKNADIKGTDIIVTNNRLLISAADQGGYTISIANSVPVVRLVRTFAKYDRAEVLPVNVNDLPSITNQNGVCVTLKSGANKTLKDFQASDVQQIIIY